MTLNKQQEQMKTLYKTGLFILIALLSFTTEAKHRKGKYTRKKEVSNSYKVNQNFNLKVDNIYGEVRIETWDKNEVSYQINVISNGDDLEKVEKRLSDIHISVDESKSKLSMVTHVDNRNRENGTFTAFVKNLFNGGGISVKSHIEINYIIKLPKKANLDITNDYGYIYIDETTGNTRLNSDYGGIRADALLSSTNVINLDYSSGSDIVHLRQADMNIAYTSIHLHHVGALKLSADYCTTKIDSIKNISFGVDYGSISLNRGQKIVGNANYVQIRIGEVEEVVDLSVSYGGLKINRIKEGFNMASINSDYASVKIGVDYSEAFVLDVETSYANLKGVQDFKTLSREEGEYKGYNKSKDTSKRISINADYGNVSIFPAN